ncbi:MAG: acyl--CoA ligase [Planctomycetes bacterium]|nr:acyl--CoA ligase [Planctomycetota bacterium]
MAVQDFLARSAERFPAKIAAICGDRRISYRDLDQQSGALALGLIQLGVRKGDRVALLLETSIELVLGIFATLKAGASFVIVAPELKPERAHTLIEDSGARVLVSRESDALRYASVPSIVRCVVVGPPSAGGVPESFHRFSALATREESGVELPIVEAEALAALIYTSGSTGRSKGVMLSHRNIEFASASILEYLQRRADDVFLDLLPLSFDYGLYNLLMPIRLGATVVLERGFLVPAQVGGVVRREKVTVLPLLPPLIALLLAYARGSASEWTEVECVTSTGQPLGAHHAEGLARLFPRARVFSMYGLTECKRATYLPPEELHRRPTSVGKAIPGTRVHLMDERGAPIHEPGVEGELWVEGPHVMQGYWGQPEASAAVLLPSERPGERILRTGDRFVRDEAGFLYFVGRRDDLIKTAGERVSLYEVERVVGAMPGVRELAVYAVPHEILGQVIEVALVLEAEASLDESGVLSHCRELLEKVKVPRRVRFLDALPRTATGKIDVRALQETGELRP